MNHLIEWESDDFERMATAHVQAETDRAFEALRKESGLPLTLENGVIGVPPEGVAREYGLPGQTAAPWVLSTLGGLGA